MSKTSKEMQNLSLSNISVEDRVKAYILNVKLAISELECSTLIQSNAQVKKVVELAKLYADDAEYYLSKGDYITALACIAYAEGLIDSLKLIYHIEVKWRSLSSLLRRPKVVVAGSFEIIHPGHIELLKWAWSLGEVFVIVARDKNVVRFKGRKPIVPEDQRLRVISSIRYVSKALLGDEDDILKPIVELKPDVVVLGPDQHVDEGELFSRLKARGVQPRILRFPRRVECPLCSSTKIALNAIKVLAEKKS